jgi:ATP-dependent DNA ligase
MPVETLADLRRRLDPLAREASPLGIPPPRSTRFGSPLVLSRVHWVEPKLVAEITYLTWTADNLLGIRSMSGCARTSLPSKCGEKRHKVTRPCGRI